MQWLTMRAAAKVAQANAENAAQAGPFNISVRGLSKSFGARKVIDKFSMSIRPGEICGFFGPNGSGKTTAIRMLCGLLRADEGSGNCLGFDLRLDHDLIRPLVGYMTQKFSLYGDLSVYENLTFFARMHGVSNRKQAVAATLEKYQLSSRAHQIADTLSGGWKQRLALATCTIHRPRLLLLDEPTAGVDPRARQEFWDRIEEIANEGVSILVSTHYMDEAERCNQIAYLAHGHLLANDTPQRLLQRSQLRVALVAREKYALLPDVSDSNTIARIVVAGNTVRVVCNDASIFAQRCWPSADYSLQAPNLEDVFFQMMDQHRASAPGHS